MKGETPDRLLIRHTFGLHYLQLLAIAACRRLHADRDIAW
jgi:hypothetical protein